MKIFVDKSSEVICLLKIFMDNWGEAVDHLEKILSEVKQVKNDLT